ncbi:Kinesin light chain 3 [Rhizophlyctis rosea]|nr:Kinesin light chain 3 [Rhizophlyctis rosea]
MPPPNESNSTAIVQTRTAELPLIGVSVAYFDTFIAECGGRDRLTNLTTAQVCNDFIIPRTQSAQSLCSRLSTEAPSIIGPATWFISHSWQYEFLDTVDALTSYFQEEEDTETIIVWFDLFSLPQHGRSKISPDWLQYTFKTVISTIGNLLMILTPWDNPITLTRAWCVFELYACADCKARFDIAIPESEQDDFTETLQADLNTFYDLIASIKSEESEASKEDDLIAIRAAVHESVGFEALDRMVLSLLSKWMIGTVESYMHFAGEGNDELEHAKWQYLLGSLYADQGMYEQAERVQTECLKIRRRLLGKNDRETLVALNNLGILYDDWGLFEKAEPLYRECWKRTRKNLEENDPLTLSAINNLAEVYYHQGRYQKAESLYIDCLRRREVVLGEENPETLAAINNLARLYGSSGKFEKAEKLWVESLARERKLLGDDHPDTLTTLHNLAILYHGFIFQGRKEYHQKAESLLTECVERQTRAFGLDHPDTHQSIRDLMVLYSLQGRYDEVEALQRRCPEAGRNIKSEVAEARAIADRPLSTTQGKQRRVLCDIL